MGCGSKLIAMLQRGCRVLGALALSREGFGRIGRFLFFVIGAKFGYFAQDGSMRTDQVLQVLINSNLVLRAYRKMFGLRQSPWPSAENQTGSRNVNRAVGPPAALGCGFDPQPRRVLTFRAGAGKRKNLGVAKCATMRGTGRPPAVDGRFTHPIVVSFGWVL
jgi:hypothetical protein